MEIITVESGGDELQSDEEKTALVPSGGNAVSTDESPEMTENIFRRHIRKNTKKASLAKHRLWMESVQHEYPMPYVSYKIGAYIRYYNQTKYGNYIEKHKQQFIDDIGMCPRWTLVDFYIDNGMTAPRMENSKEWCRLLDDCFKGKVNLIVTQKMSSVSSDPEELTFIARILAALKKPVGIYFISEDIFTLSSYYTIDLHDSGFLPKGWKVLPEDEIDREGIEGSSQKAIPEIID